MLIGWKCNGGVVFGSESGEHGHKGNEYVVENSRQTRNGAIFTFICWQTTILTNVGTRYVFCRTENFFRFCVLFVVKCIIYKINIFLILLEIFLTRSFSRSHSTIQWYKTPKICTLAAEKKNKNRRNMAQNLYMRTTTRKITETTWPICARDTTIMNGRKNRMLNTVRAVWVKQLESNCT